MIGANRTPGAGRYAAALSVPCPVCEARVHERCWSKVKAVPTRLVRPHRQRRAAK